MFKKQPTMKDDAMQLQASSAMIPWAAFILASQFSTNYDWSNKSKYII